MASLPYAEDRWDFGLARGLIGAEDDVVDLGCGEGRFLASLALRRGRTVGVDHHEPAIGDCRAGRRGLASLRASREREDTLFDVVTSFHTLEHVADPLVTARSAVRCLRPGGRLLLSVPNRERSWREEGEPLDRAASRHAVGSHATCRARPAGRAHGRGRPPGTTGPLDRARPATAGHRGAPATCPRRGLGDRPLRCSRGCSFDLARTNVECGEGFSDRGFTGTRRCSRRGGRRRSGFRVRQPAAYRHRGQGARRDVDEAQLQEPGLDLLVGVLPLVPRRVPVERVEAATRDRGAPTSAAPRGAVSTATAPGDGPRRAEGRPTARCAAADTPAGVTSGAGGSRIRDVSGGAGASRATRRASRPASPGARPTRGSFGVRRVMQHADREHDVNDPGSNGGRPASAWTTLAAGYTARFSAAASTARLRSIPMIVLAPHLATTSENRPIPHPTSSTDRPATSSGVSPVFDANVSSDSARSPSSNCVFLNVVHWYPKESAYDDGDVNRGIAADHGEPVAGDPPQPVPVLTDRRPAGRASQEAQRRRSGSVGERHQRSVAAPPEGFGNVPEAGARSSYHLPAPHELPRHRRRRVHRIPPRGCAARPRRLRGRLRRPVHRLHRQRRATCSTTRGSSSRRARSSTIRWWPS